MSQAQERVRRLGKVEDPVHKNSRGNHHPERVEEPAEAEYRPRKPRFRERKAECANERSHFHRNAQVHRNGRQGRTLRIENPDCQRRGCDEPYQHKTHALKDEQTAHEFRVRLTRRQGWS